MQLDYIKLKNYTGLKRGSDISELAIDFTKQKYGICFIIGKNKGGKSTLLNAMHPLPDNNNNFLEKEIGEKSLLYTMNDNSKILLTITHPINSKLERGTTKASFKKLMNNEYVELNPNGNIGSYKELVESYFGLDSNFLSLSMLSTEDRGIVEKTPSERKMYVTAILENLEVYNNIGKTMTKRISTLRAMLNSITAKMDSIGNKETLENNLLYYDKKINNLETRKSQSIKEQNKHELIIDTLDPDKSITDRYNLLISSLSTVKNEIKEFEDSIKDIIKENGISSIENIIRNNIEKYTNNKMLIEKEMHTLDTIIPRLLAEHEEEAKSIEIKTNKLNSLRSEENYVDIANKIKELKTIITQYEIQFSKMNIKDPLNISKDEYIIGFNAITEIRESLDSLRSGNISRDIFLTALDFVKNNINIYSEINSLNNKISEINNKISILKLKSIDFQNKLDRLTILNKRPSNCKIDKCSFISDALLISKDDPEKQLINTTIEIDQLENILINYNEELINLNNISDYINYLTIIKRDIDVNKNIILKLPHGNILTDIDYLVNASINGENFKIIDDIYKVIIDANIFDLYREYKSNMYRLENDFKLYESKSIIIDELISDINSLKSKTNETISKLDELTNNKKCLYDKLSIVENNIQKYNIILQNIDILNEKYKTVGSLQVQIKEIEADSEKIKNSIFTVNSMIKIINDIDNELIPIIKDKNNTIYSLKMLEEYEKEFKDYSDRYTKSDIIRKHSIPKTGIQKIFMDMYMKKVIKMSNEILQYFFDGDLELLEYTISDTEFTLPCYDKPSGIVNGDISFCSSSEKCILGMIISYSLLKQSASDYDILRLDEVDSALDQNNRLVFMPNMKKFKELLGVRQIIMISHASEVELDNADIIKLSQASKYAGCISGNIIYDSSIK